MLNNNVVKKGPCVRCPRYTYYGDVQVDAVSVPRAVTNSQVFVSSVEDGHCVALHGRMLRAGFDFHWNEDPPETSELASSFDDNLDKEMASIGMGLSPFETMRKLFRPFTPQSLKEQQIRQKARRKFLRQEKRSGRMPPIPPEEERRADETLAQGRVLPTGLKEAFPLGSLGEPLEDIDPYYRYSQKTFVTINSEYRIFRFSAERSLWIFGPHNALRRLALRLIIQPAFEWFMLLVILAQLAFQFYSVNGTRSSAYEFPWVFLYLHEMAVRIIARGFLFQSFSYARDPWNVIDGFLTVFWCVFLVPHWDVGGAIQCLRSFRVLRIIRECKFTSPENKSVASGITNAMGRLSRIAPVILLILSAVSVAGLQLFGGIFTRKCVRNPPPGITMTPDDLSIFFNERANWLMKPMSEEFALCGNSSGAWQCIQNHIVRDADDEEGMKTIMNFTCRQGYGVKPERIKQTFDTFSDGMLTTLRIATKDTLSTFINQMLGVCGYWFLLFIFITVFATVYCGQSLIIASVAVSFEQTVQLQRKLHKLQESEKPKRPDKNNIPDVANMSPIPQLTSLSSKEQLANGNCHQPYYTNGFLPHANGEIMYTPERTPNASRENLPDFQSMCADSYPYRYVNVSRSNEAPNRGNCCISLRRMLQRLISDPRIELGILLCLVVDAAAMVTYNYEISPDVILRLYKADLAFTIVYAVEVLLKLIALGPRTYLRDPCYVFELIMAMTSGLVHAVTDKQILPIIHAIKTVRLVRLTTLAALWRPAALLERRIRAAFRMIILLIIYVICIICVLAVIGAVVFAPSVQKHMKTEGIVEGSEARWTMSDVFHSSMVIFRTFCGRWIDPLENLEDVVGSTALPLFLIALFFGNVVLTNLFLATLLVQPRSRTGKEDGDVPLWSGSRLHELVPWIGRLGSRFRRRRETTLPMSRPSMRMVNGVELPDDLFGGAKMSTEHIDNIELQERERSLPGSTLHVPIHPTSYPPPNPSASLYSRVCPWTQGKRCASFRTCAYKFVNGKMFKFLFGVAILVACGTTMVDDKTLKERPELLQTLNIMDAAIAGVFVVEIILRWLAIGFKDLFTDPLCCLDCAVALFTLAGLAAPRGGPGDCPALRAARATRAVRIFRLTLWWPSAKVLANSLMEALPSLLSALLSCFGCYFIHACMGVRIFGGLFYKCVDGGGAPVNPDTVPNRNVCETSGLVWNNSRLTFDNFGNALFSLFHVATFEGWTPVINDAINARGMNLQPVYDNNVYVFAYFELFILLATFFYMRLFIVVLLEGYLKEKGRSLEYFAHPTRRMYVTAMQKMQGWEPKWQPPRPRAKLFCTLYETVRGSMFEAMSLVMIVLHLIPLALNYPGQHPAWVDALEFLHKSFVFIFFVEMILRFLALRCYFFADVINITDFTSVIMAIFELKGFWKAQYSYPPATLLRFLRVAARGGPLLMRSTLTRWAGVPLVAISSAGPLFFAITAIVTLLFFNAAAFATAVFGDTALKHDITGGSFHSFEDTLRILMPLSIGTDWARLLVSIQEAADGEAVRTVATAFILVLFSAALLLMSLFPAIIMAHFLEASDQSETGITDHAVDAYHVAWRRLDPDAYMYLPCEALPALVASLPAPLRPPRLGRCKLAALAIPVCRGDVVHCLDVADALVADLLTRQGHPAEEVPEALPGVLPHRRSPSYDPFTTTLHREREERSARVIQNAWHKYKTFGGQYDLR